VHALPSSQSVSTGIEHSPVVSSHLDRLHASGPWHESARAVGRLLHVPVSGTQRSSVHALPSSHSTRTGAEHSPVAGSHCDLEHRSLRFWQPSAAAVGLWSQYPVSGTQKSTVHASESSQLCAGVGGEHSPLLASQVLIEQRSAAAAARHAAAAGVSRCRHSPPAQKSTVHASASSHENRCGGGSRQAPVRSSHRASTHVSLA
jgi:hypothetical protein